jgi:hypothetical protein
MFFVLLFVLFLKVYIFWLPPCWYDDSILLVNLFIFLLLLLFVYNILLEKWFCWIIHLLISFGVIISESFILSDFFCIFLSLFFFLLLLLLFEGFHRGVMRLLIALFFYCKLFVGVKSKIKNR